MMARESRSSSGGGTTLGFRGVLLRLAESDETTAAASFYVVAPDAEMALPPPNAATGGANALSARASQILAISDRVTARLLQLTGCSTAMLQRETRSALWVADASAAAAPTRSCYCFQFRSSVEFDLFERAVCAFLRAQQLALLESSVLLELEIEQERQRDRGKPTPALTLKKKPLSRTQGSGGGMPAAAAARSVQRSRPSLPSGPPVAATGAKPLPRSDALVAAKVAITKAKPRPADDALMGTLAAAAVTTAPACILCATKAPSGQLLALHPFVLQVRLCL